MTEHEGLGPSVFCKTVGEEVPRMRCMFCSYGHMLECHYPLTCEGAECDHYLGEIESEGDYDVDYEDSAGSSQED